MTELCDNYHSECPGLNNPNCCRNNKVTVTKMTVSGEDPPVPEVAKSSTVQVKVMDIAKLHNKLKLNQVHHEALFIQIGALVVSSLLAGEVSYSDKIMGKIMDIDIKVVP